MTPRNSPAASAANWTGGRDTARTVSPAGRFSPGREYRPDEHTRPWAHMPRQRRRGAWIGPLLVLSLFGWLSLALWYAVDPGAVDDLERVE